MKLLEVAELSPRLGQSFAGPAVERLLGIGGINALYDSVRSGEGTGQEEDAAGFYDRVLRELGVEVSLSGEENLACLRPGPCVVVANHPFGAVEAILFLSLLRRIRPDAKVMANYLLMRIPELAPGVIPVDPFDREDSSRRNLSAMREAMRHLRSGGVLGIFPSGTVSHWHLSQRTVTDPAWSPHAAMLSQRAGASILPVYFHGKNGWGFQLAGLIHPLVRTALLPRELLNKRGRSLHVSVGKVLTKRQWSRFDDPDRLTAFIRAATYLLKETDPRLARAERSAGLWEPLAEAVPAETLAAEIRGLPPTAHLLRRNGFEVYLFRRQEAPRLLQEIGRLRELTFREVGEGTGKAVDLDSFDEYYEHLVLWSPRDQTVIGAYRLGRVDEVLANHGLPGLYTVTLFRFKRGFLHKLGGSIELGRSFIVPEHQRQRHSLMLLWCGIGAFLTRHPRYHTLFGPVSMSQEYTTLSRQLLVWFFKRTHRHPVLSRLVRAQRPFKGKDKLAAQRALISDCIQSIDDVSALMSEFEHDGKGVPVLFKQYLKMNALLLGFNVDASFSNVLDGLVIADLRTANPRILQKYFGEEGLRIFLDAHQSSDPVSDSSKG